LTTLERVAGLPQGDVPVCPALSPPDTGASARADDLRGQDDANGAQSARVFLCFRPGRALMVDLAALHVRLQAGVASGAADTPGMLARICASELALNGAMVTLMTETGHHELLSATDGVAAETDRLQFLLGEGPFVEAFRSRRPILVADLGGPASSRWPMFAKAVSTIPAAAVFAFPLQAGAARAGTLGFWRATVGPLDGTQLAGALLGADMVLRALLDGANPTVSAASTAGRDTALSSERAVVYQASGMVAEQCRIPIGAALARLRAHAFATDRSITDVAADVVARRLRLAPE